MNATQRFVIILSTLLVLTAGTASAAPQPEPDVTVSATGAAIDPGETAQVNVTLANNGNRTVAGNYTVTLTPPNDSWEVENGTVNSRLAPNETQSIILNVTVPESTSISTARLEVTINSTHGGQIANTTALITIQQPTSSPTTSSNNQDDSGEQSGDQDDAANNDGDGAGGAPVVFPEEDSWWEDLLSFDFEGLFDGFDISFF